MRLIHFSYEEENLVFKPFLPLQEMSLLFNRNAIGKLKAMEAINLTISYILQTATLDNKNTFSLSLTFEDEGEKFIYSFSVSEGEIITQQDPYIEKIKSWAKHAQTLSFNKVDAELNKSSISSAYQRNILFIMMKSLSEVSLNKVISQAHQLGYRISSTESIEHGELRAFYLLIYMEYISLRTKPSLLLIENFCEKVEYEHSTQLGKLLLSFCLKHNIQLIISSNNTFLINVLDMKYWNILLRKAIK